MVDCSRFIVVLINIIFLIFGLAFLVIGIVFKVGWDDVRDAFVDQADKADLNLQDAGDTFAIGAIVLGVFIILVALFGLIGACCKVKCLLVVYAIIVAILLIAELAVVIYAAVKGSTAEDKLKTELVKTMTPYYENSTNPQSKAWSAVFSTFKCCGVDGLTDFSNGNVTLIKSNLRPANLTSSKVPITCCRDFDYEGTETAASFTSHSACLTKPDSTNAYMNGCVKEIKDDITKYKGILIGVGVAILVIEVLAIILSMVLCCRHDED